MEFVFIHHSSLQLFWDCIKEIYRALQRSFVHNVLPHITGFFSLFLIPFGRLRLPLTERIVESRTQDDEGFGFETARLSGDPSNSLQLIWEASSHELESADGHSSLKTLHHLNVKNPETICSWILASKKLVSMGNIRVGSLVVLRVSCWKPWRLTTVWCYSHDKHCASK